MLLAVGFVVRWHGRPLAAWRHPYVGLLVILAAAGLRWLSSPAFRRWTARNLRLDAAGLRQFASGQGRIPWRPAILWVFLGAWLAYLANDRCHGSGDTVPTMWTAYTLAHDGTLALDRFVTNDSLPYFVSRIGEHTYTAYNLGAVILAVPFVWAADQMGGDVLVFDHLRRLEKAIAAFYAAAAVAVVFLVLLRLVALRTAALLTVFYAFGSENWAVSSQGLWQHGPVALCAALVMLVEVYYRGCVPTGAILLQGLLLGFGVACRPTAALLALAWVVLRLVRQPTRTPALILGLCLSYLPFLWVHWTVWGSILGPYRNFGTADVWRGDLLGGLAGHLVSPARGLLVYQPLFALVALSFAPLVWRRLGPGTTAALGAWIVGHLLLVSSFVMWWGGYCWGPRLLTELAPAFVLLVAPTCEHLARRRTGRVAVHLLIAWCILLQGAGVLDREAGRWHVDPVNVDQAPQRLWQWHDPPFLYAWTRSHRP